jgi:hypothetical protein
MYVGVQNESKVVYIQPEKAKRINDILAAEREFHELKKQNHEGQTKRKTY